MQLHPAHQAGASLPASASIRRSRDLPNPIHEARLRLGELTHGTGELRQLSMRGVTVLYEYLGKTDLRSLDEAGRMRVFDTTVYELERATGYSRRSITGANADLVRAGLIERPPQDMRGARKAGTPIGHTLLTPRAVALFFGPRAQTVAPPLYREPNSVEGQGAKAPAAEMDQPVIECSPAATSTVLPSGSTFHVRHDLAPLLQRLLPQQLRKVLAIARDAGVWLQDVMVHKLPAILTARDPVGLLVHLLRSGEDWRSRPLARVGNHAARHERLAAAEGISTPVSEASASTRAGWREDEARERAAAEHRQHRTRPSAEQRQRLAEIRQAAAVATARATPRTDERGQPLPLP